MTIWFNHWFSTAYHLINMMREGMSGQCRVIGSGTNDVSVFRTACDEWHSEPKDLSGEEYAQWCLDFCREHGVDVFVPRRGLVEIITRSADFEAAGVKLFADHRADIAVQLDDKIQTYEMLKDICPEFIPPVYEVKSLDEFKAAYEALKPHWDRVCYKLTIDEGARSFRIIDPKIEGINGLYNKPGFKVTYTAACSVLSEYDFSIPMLVMPYLSGKEYSCDCLATAQGNLIIPRYKTGKRYSIVSFMPQMMSACERIMDRLQLKMPMNIQFKCEGDTPYLLEINPRMSGGLQLSCKATGINLPAIALGQLLGREVPWEYPEITEQKVAHIESPICL